MPKVDSHVRFSHYSTLRDQNGNVWPNAAKRCFENSNKIYFICFESIGTAMQILFFYLEDSKFSHKNYRICRKKILHYLVNNKNLQQPFFLVIFTATCFELILGNAIAHFLKCFIKYLV